MILSSLKPSGLIDVIASGDDVSLTAIKGIGSKTAQRIVVDLKNKVRPVEGLDERKASAGMGRPATGEEAVAALVMLGFQKASSQKAIDSLLKKTPDMTVEQLIKTALTML